VKLEKKEDFDVWLPGAAARVAAFPRADLINSFKPGFIRVPRHHLKGEIMKKTFFEKIEGPAMFVVVLIAICCLASIVVVAVTPEVQECEPVVLCEFDIVAPHTSNGYEMEEPRVVGKQDPNGFYPVVCGGEKYFICPRMLVDIGGKEFIFQQVVFPRYESNTDLPDRTQGVER